MFKRHIKYPVFGQNIFRYLAHLVSSWIVKITRWFTPTLWDVYRGKATLNFLYKRHRSFLDSPILHSTSTYNIYIMYNTIKCAVC